MVGIFYPAPMIPDLLKLSAHLQSKIRSTIAKIIIVINILIYTFILFFLNVEFVSALFINRVIPFLQLSHFQALRSIPIAIRIESYCKISSI